MKQSALSAVILILLSIFFVSSDCFCGTKEEAEDAIRVMKKAIEEKNDPMRNRMYFKLRQIGSGAVAPLIENLNDPNEDFAGYCGFVLGWINDIKAVEPLIKKLNGSSNMKISCCKALGNMAWGTPEKIRTYVVQKALDPIIKLLNDPDVRVRRDAAYSLGLMGEERAIAFLQQAEKDDDDLVKWFATEAINRIKTTKELFLRDN
ncbi:MAG: hypothetical protein A2161_13460 [Candidatus Schekmanbacteria bacterium RBG_13_48_7]|uniref:HEAT repeat domain-containing protein n=1 Tax=Candidatus Schekmanbacteria bacterium RBG_13_48_7 TaxID=1817878 RepID=A0A1F7S9H6_9BACT|nr:MAG: hypothetical protein A2161_13460 [Candidatus Schekmanbacteria bacterium RBG_13_48_7]